MSLKDIDANLHLDLLLMALKAARAGWEAYPPQISEDVEIGHCDVLLWLNVGEGMTWN